MRPPHVIAARAAELRAEHYSSLGAVILPWDRLTDAQKVPWILRAAEE